MSEGVVDSKGSIIVLCLSIFAVMLGLGFIAPLLPLYAETLGASGFEVGLVFSSFAITRALTMTPLGNLSDFWGRKIFIVLGTLLFSLASILYVFAVNVQQLILFRVLHGFASALVIPAAMAYVADLFPESRRGEAMGVFNMAFFAGVGFGPLIGGVLAAKAGFYWPFYVCSLVAFTGFLLSLFRLKESKKPDFKKGKPKISYGFGLLKDKNIFSVVFSRMTVAIGISSIIAFLPLLAHEFGIGIMETGLLLTIQHSALILSQKKFGKISDRYGRKYPMFLGCLIGAIALIFIGASRSFLSFLIILIIFGLSGGLTVPASSAAVADIAGREKFGEAMGLFTTAISIGMTLGATLGGLVADFFGLTNIFYVAAFLSFPGALILLGFEEKEKGKP